MAQCKATQGTTAGLPTCPQCGAIARYTYCMQCGSPVRPYAVVLEEIDVEETDVEEEEEIDS